MTRSAASAAVDISGIGSEGIHKAVGKTLSCHTHIEYSDTSVTVNVALDYLLLGNGEHAVVSGQTQTAVCAECNFITGGHILFVENEIHVI